MDGACFGATCTGLTTQAYATANKCSVQKEVNENEDGCEFSSIVRHVKCVC